MSATLYILLTIFCLVLSVEGGGGMSRPNVLADVNDHRVKLYKNRQGEISFGGRQSSFHISDIQNDRHAGNTLNLSVGSFYPDDSGLLEDSNIELFESIKRSKALETISEEVTEHCDMSMVAGITISSTDKPVKFSDYFTNGIEPLETTPLDRSLTKNAKVSVGRLHTATAKGTGTRYLVKVYEADQFESFLSDVDVQRLITTLPNNSDFTNYVTCAQDSDHYFIFMSPNEELFPLNDTKVAESVRGLDTISKLEFYIRVTKAVRLLKMYDLINPCLYLDNILVSKDLSKVRLANFEHMTNYKEADPRDIQNLTCPFLKFEVDDLDDYLIRSDVINLLRIFMFLDRSLDFNSGNKAGVVVSVTKIKNVNEYMWKQIYGKSKLSPTKRYKRLIEQATPKEFNASVHINPKMGLAIGILECLHCDTPLQNLRFAHKYSSTHKFYLRWLLREKNHRFSMDAFVKDLEKMKEQRTERFNRRQARTALQQNHVFRGSLENTIAGADNLSPIDIVSNSNYLI